MLGEASTKWYRTQGYYDSAAWRGTYAMDGGSLMTQGVHYVDLLRWCMGPATEVTAVCTTQTHRLQAEDTALAIVRLRLQAHSQSTARSGRCVRGQRRARVSTPSGSTAEGL